MKKLISFEDFKSKKIVKEGIDEIISDEGVNEIIPEGLPEEDSNIEDDDKIEKISSFISGADEDIIEEIVNYLRDSLLELEQEGFVDEDFTDELDDKHIDDWESWILEVINLPEFPKEGLDGALNIIDDYIESGDQLGVDDDDDDDDVECPDCDGTGLDEDGEDCERCEGAGRVYRPYDIPSDN